MTRQKYSTYLLSSYTPDNIIAEKKVMISGSSEMHFHDCMEFELCINGGGYQILNGKRAEIAKNNLTLLGPLDYHEVGAYEEGIELLTLMFRPHLISNEFIHYFNKPHGYSMALDNERYDLVLALFQAVSQAYKCNVKDDIISDLINCIIKSSISTQGFESDIKKYDGKFSEIVSYVNLHFRESPAIGDIAGLFHYNKNYICNLFEKHLGITYKDYLTELKVKYAEKLLKTTDLPVSRICYECGFGSFSAVNRAFKKVLGKTPTQIRTE